MWHKHLGIEDAADAAARCFTDDCSTYEHLASSIRIKRIRKNSFTASVDRMFTTLVGALFTKHVDRAARCNLAACMSRSCNAD
ncbi:hypothetical protein ACQR16_30735 [Bradyrhizobium oligotrophicum]|uniref:hypothetical protein n=1 Tax=Bradyrhizobium oligotrophicum TaxID=44255 RepID=UPI003EBD005E